MVVVVVVVAVVVAVAVAVAVGRARCSAGRSTAGRLAPSQRWTAGERQGKGWLGTAPAGGGAHTGLRSGEWGGAVVLHGFGPSTGRKDRSHAEHTLSPSSSSLRIRSGARAAHRCSRCSDSELLAAGSGSARGDERLPQLRGRRGARDAGRQRADKVRAFTVARGEAVEAAAAVEIAAVLGDASNEDAQRVALLVNRIVGMLTRLIRP